VSGVPRHGHTAGGVFTPTYSSWAAMLSRCQNPSHRSYARYGGRGISVCARWLVFENFLADMGDRPPGMTLERIDGHRPYEPSNCVWATISQQNMNKDCNPHFEFNGKRLTLGAWASELGLDRTTLQKRIYKLGWPLEKALSPVLHGRWGRIAEGLNPGRRKS
jgi:hypothetical protein